MEAYNEQIEKIKGGIPSERYVQQYLEEFVIDASKAGFVVTKFSRVEEFPDKIVLEIDLEGQPNNLPTLIDGIESSQRFASVNEIKTEKHEVSTKVRVVLEIFEI